MARQEDMSQDEKVWLYECTSRMHTVFNASNIYQMLPRAYEDLGLYGIHSSIILPDFENVVRAQSFPIGEYYVGQNDREVIDTFHREFRRTVDQVVRKYHGTGHSINKLKEYHGQSKATSEVDQKIFDEVQESDGDIQKEKKPAANGRFPEDYLC